jgi:hypothetical protein
MKRLWISDTRFGLCDMISVTHEQIARKAVFGATDCFFFLPLWSFMSPNHQWKKSSDSLITFIIFNLHADEMCDDEWKKKAIITQTSPLVI